MTGVLLIQLGTPAAPTAWALYRYLVAFLGDARVVDLPRAFWLPLLYGVIAPLRAPRSAAAYRRIWKKDGSPLLMHSRQLAARLQEALGVPVALGMRYGSPSVASALDALLAQGMARIVVVPLFPQASSTTTAAALDAVAAALRRTRKVPALCCIRDWADHARYLDTLAAHVRAFWNEHGQGERLVLSFHGIPVRYAQAGDPYPARCAATAKGLRKRLGLAEEHAPMAFQSRFGPEAWLAPSLEEVLTQLAREGVSTVDVLAPSFAVDCLETLEEIAIRMREHFLAAGGRELRYIPALNATDAHVALLAALVREQAGAWL